MKPRKQRKKEKKQKNTTAAAKSKMYSGCPGASDCEATCNHWKPSAEPTHWPIEAGNSKMLEAKIAGMTPAILTLSGR